MQFYMLLLLFCNSLRLISAAPSSDFHILSRRWFIPTPEQARQHLVPPGKDKAMYFSRPASGGAFARANGLKTINYGKWLDLDNKDGPLYGLHANGKDDSHNEEKIWDVLSAEFAHATSGEVHVALPDTVRDRATWARIELPILKAKPDVVIYQVLAKGTDKSLRKQIWPEKAATPPLGSSSKHASESSPKGSHKTLHRRVLQ